MEEFNDKIVAQIDANSSHDSTIRKDETDVGTKGNK